MLRFTVQSAAYRDGCHSVRFASPLRSSVPCSHNKVSEAVSVVHNYKLFIKRYHDFKDYMNTVEQRPLRSWKCIAWWL